MAQASSLKFCDTCMLLKQNREYFLFPYHNLNHQDSNISSCSLYFEGWYWLRADKGCDIKVLLVGNKQYQ